MFFIKYALKNVFRKKGRTFLTIIPIIVGTTLLIWTISLVEGMNRASYENIIDCQTAHLQIFNKNYDFEKINNIKHTFLFDDTLKDFLEQSYLIEHFTTLLIFECKLSDRVNKLPIIVYGVDTAYSNVFTTFFRKLNDSINIPNNGEIILGRDLKELFDFNINQPIYLEARTKFGTFDAIQLNLIAFLYSGNPEIDGNAAFISIENAKQFMDTDNEITSIAIKLKNINDIEKFKNSMNVFFEKYNYNNLKVSDWKEQKKDFLAFALADRVSAYIFIFIIIVIAGIGIANTMLLSVYERIKEIATIRAIGSNKKTIMKIFLIESVIIGVLGAIVGGFIGIIIMYYTSNYGIDLSGAFGKVDIGYPVELILRGVFNINIVLRVILFTAIIAIIAGIYPAHRANSEYIARILK